jgi:V/A-type H+-transporting ATPase subunit E
MAGADMILKKILDDARKDAAQMLTEARERAETTQERSKAGIEAAKQEAEQKAGRDAEQRKERTLRMAQLDARKEELAMKRELIDEAFSFALRRLIAMDPDRKGVLFERMLYSSAQGGETVLPAQDDKNIFTQEFLEKINNNLSREGKTAVRLGDIAPGIQGGFLLALGGMECNCSLESLLRQERDALEPAVARALFPAKEG